MDLLDLLAADHRDLQALFAEYRGLARKALHSKHVIATRLFDALEAHARLEEELFYPELERASRARPGAGNEASAETLEAVSSALTEHEEMRLLIRGLGESGPADPLFDVRMKALEEVVANHIAEEEEALMPASREILGAERLDALGRRAERARPRVAAEEGEEPPIPPVTRL